MTIKKRRGGEVKLMITSYTSAMRLLGAIMYGAHTTQSALTEHVNRGIDK